MEEKKYPIGGYAPGSYHNRCTTCERSFFGDKRAVQCEPCAVKYAKDNNIPMDEVPPIAESNEKDFIGNVHQTVFDFITWYNTTVK